MRNFNFKKAYFAKSKFREIIFCYQTDWILEVAILLVSFPLCSLSTVHCLLPFVQCPHHVLYNVHFPLPAHCLPPAAHCPLSTAQYHCLLPTIYCPLSLTHCLLSTALCPLSTAHQSNAHCLLSTIYCIAHRLLPTAYCPLLIVHCTLPTVTCSLCMLYFRCIFGSLSFFNMMTAWKKII